jgi:hypothetical protein
MNFLNGLRSADESLDIGTPAHPDQSTTKTRRSRVILTCPGAFCIWTEDTSRPSGPNR